MKERRTLLLAIAVLALILRLIYIWQISYAPFFHLRLGDAAEYHQWALRIVGGDWRGEGVFYQAPLYPYFLAAVYSVFGDGVAMVRFIQAVIGAGSCVLLAAAGISLFGRWGAIAGVLLAIYPSAIFLDGLLEKTALVTFFTAALLCLIAGRIKFREFIVGVVLGLLALSRENALLLAIPVLLWFVIAERRPRAAAAFLVGCALVLLPVGLRNYAVGGEFHLTTSQFGPNFYIGNHAGANGLYDPLVPGHGSVADERADATRIAEEAEGRTLSAGEVSSVLDVTRSGVHSRAARRLAAAARAKAGAHLQRRRDRRHRIAGGLRRVVVSCSACSRCSTLACSCASLHSASA